MGNLLLNKTCIFRCPNLAGAIQIQQMNHQFQNGTATALTVNTCLSGVGICSVLTAAANGVPTQCTLKMAKNWSSGIELFKTVNGVALLNQNAKIICPVGGVISAFSLPVIPVPVIPDVSAVMPETASNLNESVTSAETNQNTAKTEQTPEKSESSEASEKTESQSVPEQEQQTEQEQSASQNQNISVCPTCEKADICRYRLTPDTISTEGAAAKLRRNSPAKETAYDMHCDRLMEQYQTSWGNQAHHMISVKAAYCQYPALVKLGNYFGYDINYEENCYFLPAWEKGDGYGEKNSHYKKAQAYEIMKISGLQWHVGQHTYAVTIPENVLEKYPHLRGMVCYNTRINQDVKAILARCCEKFGDTCLEEHYEEYRLWFLGQMHQLSEQIEEHLDLFRSYPKDSFPYYVSLEALRFAYEIPRSGKVISVHRTSGKWVLRKYRYTNYLRNDNFELEQTETLTLALTEHHRDETVRKLILFCENVSCFLLIAETGTFQLPFTFRVRSCCIRQEDNIRSHFSAMLAEMAENQENQYLSPKAMVYKRMEECGLL